MTTLKQQYLALRKAGQSIEQAAASLNLRVCWRGPRDYPNLVLLDQNGNTVYYDGPSMSRQ